MASKGYTLIEIMVAVGIFFVIIAAPTGFFVSSLKGQQKALSSQELIDNISYNLEYLSRTLRMAKKELNCTSKTDPLTCNCLTNFGYGYNYEITREGKGIRFINSQNICQEIFWDTTEKRLKEVKRGTGEVPLTSNDLEVVSFRIGPYTSWDQNDPGNDQPKVTLSFEIKGKRYQKPEVQPVLKIQTTISQRNLDVPY